MSKLLQKQSNVGHSQSTLKSREVFKSKIEKTFKEQCNFINKLTGEECCISYDKININNDYMICNTCNKQYLFENINEWLKIQNTCPHCR
jgi:hypothetical protein